jgi:ABC-type dipeptide/oligopeptide/nickel transport system permease subunit
MWRRTRLSNADGVPVGYVSVEDWPDLVTYIFLAVLSCNFDGNGLRDVLDPKERTRRR